MAQSPLIDVQDISKRFGSVIALSGVSMAVDAGEVHCLLDRVGEEHAPAGGPGGHDVAVVAEDGESLGGQ